MDRLRRRDAGVGIAHHRMDDHSALDDQVGLGAEEGRGPDDKVGELAGLDRADLMPHALRDCRVDRIFRSEEHTSELQSLMRISYAVFCLKTKKLTRAETHQ